MTRARILVGDCRASMATLADASIDAVVCDPPYELGFMGKRWDASGIAYDLEVWRQCLRVLKPGGHLLAFSGSRTYHRMACAIEDAGFDVRDQIMWLYGSGFPKSHDISKALDAIDRIGPMEARARTFTAWMRSTGITAQQINEATGSFMGSHYLTEKSQPSVATADLFDLLRPILPPVPDEIEELVRSRTVESENLKRRAVIGEHRSTSPGCNMRTGMLGTEKDDVGTVTTAYTAAARQWSGWGTALKPAHEPICIARKPLVGTVAANVLRYGTGAINVDGCRAFVDENEPNRINKESRNGSSKSIGGNGVYAGGSVGRGPTLQHPAGRWPANVLHDGSDEVTDGLREAARFFYTAKAGRDDREEGLTADNMLCSCEATRKEWAEEDRRANTRPASGSHPKRDTIASTTEGGSEWRTTSHGNAQTGLFLTATTSTTSTTTEPTTDRRTCSSSLGLSTSAFIPDASCGGMYGGNPAGSAESQSLLGPNTSTCAATNPSTGDAKAVTSHGSSRRSAFDVRVCPRCGKRDRKPGAGDAVDRDEGSAGMRSPRAGAGRTARDGVWCSHPTVKPTELMRYLVRMVTPPGGLVLDPFTGSGSTGRAAMLEGMRFVGCELSPEYAEIARARIRFTLGPLFAHLVE
jgi:DNA modification methylase